MCSHKSALASIFTGYAFDIHSEFLADLGKPPALIPDFRIALTTGLFEHHPAAIRVKAASSSRDASPCK